MGTSQQQINFNTADLKDGKWDSHDASLSMTVTHTSGFSGPNPKKSIGSHLYGRL